MSAFAAYKKAVAEEKSVSELQPEVLFYVGTLGRLVLKPMVTHLLDLFRMI